jgi:ubiquinone/menaquinone biosynthesis C-methylase UbiE
MNKKTIHREFLRDVVEEYNRVNLLLGESNINFMNHGYSPSYEIISEDDFIFKNQISLYLNMFDGIDSKGKTILEVGCGRGGGISAIKKYLDTDKLFACDINELNIEYCKKNHDKSIEFKVSDAHKLQYPNSFFDILISVESSHCYHGLKSFFSEVSRVLKPGGIFLYTDCGENIKMFSTESSMFTDIKREDITKNVRQSCIEDYEKWKLLILDEGIKEKFTRIALLKSEDYENGSDMYLKYIAINKSLGDNSEQT